MGTQIFSSPVDTSQMIHIPAGEFIYGVEIPEHDGQHERTLVHLEGYWIDRTPVTFAQYHEFIVATEYLPPLRGVSRSWEKCYLPYLWESKKRSPKEYAEMPMIFVSWYDAFAYCEWTGKSLPTEWEWEKAARGTDGRTFPWGEDPNASQYCHCLETDDLVSEMHLASVNAFPQGISPYGCLDMLGNASEWCLNSYWVEQGNYRSPVMETILPQIPIPYHEGESVRSVGRVVRGFNRIRIPAPITERYPADPWSISPYVGFRCVYREP